MFQFTHALDALDHLSTSSLSDPPCLREDHEAHVLAVYHRTASNLLLEYSAAQLRIRRLLFDLRTIHQRLTAKGSQWKDSRRTQRVLWLRDPSYAPKEVIGETLASRLEAVIGELTTLVSYLDRITEKLVSSNTSCTCFVRVTCFTGAAKCPRMAHNEPRNGLVSQLECPSRPFCSFHSEPKTTMDLFWKHE